MAGGPSQRNSDSLLKVKPVVYKYWKYTENKTIFKMNTLHNYLIFKMNIFKSDFSGLLKPENTASEASRKIGCSGEPELVFWGLKSSFWGLDIRMGILRFLGSVEVPKSLFRVSRKPIFWGLESSFWGLGFFLGPDQNLKKNPGYITT